jgi:1-acyl-sn-glycerol-3-phosphate acyltransferase
MVCSGAHRIMEKRSLVIHPGEIVVEFLDPIDPAGYSLEQRDILNEKIWDAMAAALPPDQRPLDSPDATAEPAVS